LVEFSTTDHAALAQYLPFHTVNAGRFVAVYFPAFGGGVVTLGDEVDGGHVWVRAPLGKILTDTQRLVPGHRYWIYVLMDRPGRFVFPDRGYRVISVHSRALRVSFASQALTIAGGSPEASYGTMRNVLATSDISVTAVVVRYDHPSGRIWGGAACAAPTPVYPCPPGPAASTFNGYEYGGGGDGNDQTSVFSQDITGTTYNSAQSAAYLDGDFELFDGSPYTSARLIAFGIRLSQ
jgi:hypothetical protein